ncbi:MAG: hypothetical protein E7523_09165 [Ruminococcaceae bacterium]|nr:hypothetical protein [Oscillospiraceae bacterium]
MDLNICFNCMQIAENGAVVCKHCGMLLGKIPDGELSALKIGTVLHGRYLVGRQLGRGGFGITYMGFDLVLLSRIAIKEYYPRNDACRDNSCSPMLIWKNEEDYKTGCQSILREARKLAKVSKIQNVVRVQDTFEENHTAYIIMDYIEGITLKEKIKQEGAMSFKSCIELLNPVLLGLKELHNSNIVHRDISPDNIMITGNNEAFLLDMGAAKDISASTEYSEPIGVVKRGYSPYEQYNRNAPIGSWVDVYAVSATVFYCISGGKVLKNSIERFDGESVDFSSLKVKISKKEKELLLKGLAIDYRARIQTVDPFIAYCEKKGAGKTIKIIGFAAVLVLAIGCISVLVSSNSHYTDMKNENYDIAEKDIISENGETYYIIPEQDLTYELTEDNCIKITGYTPSSDSPTDCMILPDTLNNFPVTILGENAFAESKIEKLICNESLECIERRAFYLSDISEIKLNEGLMQLGDECFYASEVERIDLPDSIQKLSGATFAGAGYLKGIYVSNKNQFYAHDDGVLFTKNKKTLIAFPMAYDAESYSVPDDVIVIDRYAFFRSSLKTVQLPDTLEKIASYAFYNTDLVSINYPMELKVMEEKALRINTAILDSSFKSVSLGKGQSETISITTGNKKGSLFFFYDDSSVCSAVWLNTSANSSSHLLKITGENAGEGSITVLLLVAGYIESSLEIPIVIS